jgi:raffinose/stachyose/melibiose transport system permease protein
VTSAVQGRRDASRLWRSRYGTRRAWLFLLPPLVLMIACVAWPTVFLVWLSTQKWDGLGSATFVGLNNFSRVFADDRFWIAIQNNLKWSVASAIVPPAVGLGLAILLSRSTIRGRGVFRIVYFTPQIVASAIVAIIWRWIYAPDGPVNAILGTLGVANPPLWLADADVALIAVFIAYAWVTFGFSMLIFETAIRSIDEELFDAAKVDGATFLAEVRHILLPGIRPAIATVLVVSTIWSFQIFDLIYLTTAGGPGDATMVLSIGIYTSMFAARDVGRGAAMALVLLAVIVMLASLIAAGRARREARP